MYVLIKNLDSISLAPGIPGFILLYFTVRAGSPQQHVPITVEPYCLLADLTVSKRPGTSYQIEIHFAVVNHLYLLFSFVKLAET